MAPLDVRADSAQRSRQAENLSSVRTSAMRVGCRKEPWQSENRLVAIPSDWHGKPRRGLIHGSKERSPRLGLGKKEEKGKNLVVRNNSHILSQTSHKGDMMIRLQILIQNFFNR